MGNRTYVVEAILGDLKDVRRRVRAMSRDDAEQEAWRMYPTAVAVLVEEELNAWA